MDMFEIVVIEERGAFMDLVIYPGIPIDWTRGILTVITHQTFFHKLIIHILLANINHFFNFNKKKKLPTDYTDYTDYTY